MKENPQYDLFGNINQKKQKKEKTDFFQNQPAKHTLQKLQILSEYLKVYLGIITPTTNIVHIIDAYAGSGKNGNEDGSPLIVCKALFSIKEKYQNANLKYFGNELELERFLKLEENLNEFKDLIRLSNNDAKDFLKTYLNSSSAKYGSNLFFIDPFNYSFFKEDIDMIFSKSNTFATEILLFIPLNYIFRFKQIDNEKIEKFLNSYDIKCEDIKDINDFVHAIKAKIDEKHICTYSLLRDRAQTYGLFLITHHLKGADVFLQARDKVLNIASSYDISLFPLPKTNTTLLLERLAIGNMTNVTLYEWSLKNCISIRELKAEIQNLINDKIFIKPLRKIKGNALYINSDNYRDKKDYLEFSLRRE